MSAALPRCGEQLPCDRSPPRIRPTLAAIETREWQDSLDYVLQSGGPARAAQILQRARGPRAPPRPQAAVHGQHALRQHDRRRRADARPRQQRDRAPHQEPRPLERDGHGRQGQPGERRHRRPHLDLRLVGDAVRSRASTTSSRARTTRQGGDFVYFQGHASPGMYCARVPRRPAVASSSSRTSAAS